MPFSERGRTPITYQIILTNRAENDLRALDTPIARRMMEKLQWLGKYAAQIVHHSLTSMPEDLKGLCRLRVGDWRILYRVYHERCEIVVYGVMHRSKAYRGL